MIVENQSEVIGWLERQSALPDTEDTERIGTHTIVPLPDGSIFYGSAATAEYHDMDWLTEHLPKVSDIRIESRTNTHTMMVLAGPRTRDLLAAVSPRTKWEQSEFPHRFHSIKCPAYG